MKNKVIRGVLAAACVTTAVSAANVFGAGTEQSLVNEASAVTQEETEETLSLIHISEPTRRVVISYAVFCLKKFFFNDTATTEIYTRLVVGSVRCV